MKTDSAKGNSLMSGYVNEASSLYAKPTTVDEFINFVNRFSEEHRENVLHSVALNVLKRANLCEQQNGGHFQHLL